MFSPRESRKPAWIPENSAKFFALRDVLVKHGATPGPLPAQTPAVGYGSVSLDEGCSLFDVLAGLPAPIRSPYPLTMEEAGQSYGFILYRTTIGGPMTEMPLTITEVRDRAWVFLDGRFLGIADRNTPQNLTLSVSANAAHLDILVENLGRVNHDVHQPECKGITHCVLIAGQAQADWEIFPLDFTRLPDLPWQRSRETTRAAFHRGVLSVETPQDTFLEVGGRHGVAWINGFCLGRYWEIGPQKRLFVPGPILRKGANELVIFEVEGECVPTATFFDSTAWMIEPSGG